MYTIIVFIIGAMVGNLFGMALMGLLMGPRNGNDADHAYREYKVDKQSANK